MLAILISVSAIADNTINNIPDDPEYTVYYEDENGHIRKWQPKQRYETWTDIDENVYDYEVIIKVK